MKLHTLIAANTLLPLLLGAAANALPINCAHARTPDEKTVCSDPTLIQADARLDTLYDISQHLVPMGTRGDLVDSQRAWIKQRRACATDIACIRSAYTTRSAVFEAILKRVEQHGPF